MNDPHDRSLGEVMDAVRERLDRAPLVWIEDGCFIVRDEKAPGLRYDFRCRNAGEALAWVEHLAQKAWITTEHLEQFATQAIETFKVRRP